ncbi:MAG: fused response regulator/phosphatase [Verrucomicrobiaceae bacterium]|nr:MAG: fused response regulator/phosphatase [Verrucomicrobiaceae bacterium]
MVVRTIRVLVVEDNPTDRLLVRTTLARSKTTRFEVTEVERVASAIEILLDRQFDVILVDLALPDSQGLETYHKIRKAAGSRSPAIIVVSGLSDEAVAIEAVKAGAQDYLLKSYQIGDLLPRSIRYAIERKHAQEEIEQYTWELRAKNKELEDELRMAREIQQALLPHQYPRFSNGSPSFRDALHFSHCYRPATSLSGDFFDVLHISDSEAGMFICDVMGHGPRAALIGALTRGLIEQFRPVAAQPGEFLSALNQSLSSILQRAEITAFVTGFYLVADLEKCQLRYSNAGHPSPFLIRRDLGTVHRLRTGEGHRNPPLGLFLNQTYPTNATALSDHHSVVMFTDGLYEAENPQGEVYGRQRLLAAVRARVGVPCEQLFAELVADVQSFSERPDFEDDVCLVGMEVSQTNKEPLAEVESMPVEQLGMVESA